MVRLVFLLRRASHLSLGEFHDYWRNAHAPLVARYQTAMGLVRYVQAHALDDEQNARMAAQRDGAMEPRYDGVAELWWESEEDLTTHAGTPEGREAGAALLEDERRFIDLAQSPLWLAHEYPQVNPTPESIVARERSGVVKLHFPLRHLPTLTMEEAQRYWRVQHGPKIRRHAAASGLLRYQQVHRYESPVEAMLRSARGTVTDAYTGHAEAWFDRSVARSGPEVRAASAAAVADERNFIDFTRSTMWIGKEHVIVDRL
jgi:uncharacterized protein (TIGR02118 family)